MIKSILCVCRGNFCRSPMLEGFLQRELEGRVRVESAGTYASLDLTAKLGGPATKYSILCMAERGIDISGHKSRKVSDIDLNGFELIICLSYAEFDFITRLHPRGAVLLADAVNGGIPDPWQQGLQDYEACADALAKVANYIVETYF